MLRILMLKINEINDGDIDERDEPDDLLCAAPKKRLNTSLEIMGISPVNLHGIAQHSRALSARAKLKKLVGTLKTIISKSKNAWFYANCVKCMLHLREKKMQMLS